MKKFITRGVIAVVLGVAGIAMATDQTAGGNGGLNNPASVPLVGPLPVPCTTTSATCPK